ncbi:hypothetical protein V9T40_002710 [Parthenolecanium corni]|uniref:Uncharacterized protein n=1 Tax=Parthenolecanium corni TaxID=536013 RepID=A0AAN9TGN0_9HEMI
MPIILFADRYVWKLLNPDSPDWQIVTDDEHASSPQNELSDGKNSFAYEWKVDDYDYRRPEIEERIIEFPKCQLAFFRFPESGILEPGIWYGRAFPDICIVENLAGLQNFENADKSMGYENEGKYFLLYELSCQIFLKDYGLFGFLMDEFQPRIEACKNNMNIYYENDVCYVLRLKSPQLSFKLQRNGSMNACLKTKLESSPDWQIVTEDEHASSPQNELSDGKNSFAYEWEVNTKRYDYRQPEIEEPIIEFPKCGLSSLILREFRPKITKPNILAVDFNDIVKHYQEEKNESFASVLSANYPLHMRREINSLGTFSPNLLPDLLYHWGKNNMNIYYENDVCYVLRLKSPQLSFKLQRNGNMNVCLKTKLESSCLYKWMCGGELSPGMDRG